MATKKTIKRETALMRQAFEFYYNLGQDRNCGRSRIRLKVPGLEGKYDFTGKKIDEGTGLTYFGAQFYDQESCRFTTMDPARDGRNWYTYCYNNPLRLVDPMGLASEDSSNGASPYCGPGGAANANATS